MRVQRSLSEGWHVKQLDAGKPDIDALTREAISPDDTWLSARMPAQVHDILLQHGLISDPHVDKNEANSAWVGQEVWAYACKFVSPDEVAVPIMLRFGGLDTLAEAYLNGSHIGGFDNMHREYCVDVRECLAPSGEDNILLIIFSSPLRFASEIEQPAKNVGKSKYLRKCSSDFGSYLGASPHSVKVGVYRDVTLDIPDRAWIEDINIRSEISSDFQSAKVRVHVDTAGAEASLSWKLLDASGHEVASGAESATSDGYNVEISLNDPELWWPWTHGTPHLYQLQADLTMDHEKLDSRTVEFGIRDIKAIFTDEETGEKRFRFQINGQPIFLKAHVGRLWRV